jgi:hypothetical protein
VATDPANAATNSPPSSVAVRGVAQTPAPQTQVPAVSHRAGSEGGAGQLSVICIPGCDQVYDNGKLLGASPVFKRPTTLGSHKIRLVTQNPHVEKTISTIVVADQVAVVRESMQ